MTICFWRSTRIIVTQTFQAVVLVQTKTLRSHRSFFKYQYVSLNRRHHVLRFKNTPVALKLSVNCSELSLHPCIRVFSILSELGTNFNVSLTQYQFEGYNGTDCLYGGLAIIEEHVLPTLPFQTLRTVCMLSQQVQVQNVYSSTHRLVIVGYAYPENSPLYAQVNISKTLCHNFRINICKLQWCQTYFNPKRSNPMICLPGTRFRIPEGYYFSKAMKVYVKEDESCKVVQLVNSPYFDTDVSFSNKECMLFLSFCKVSKERKHLLYDIQVEGFLSVFWNYAFGDKTRLAQSVIVGGKRLFHNKETDSTFVRIDEHGIPLKSELFPFYLMFYKHTRKAYTLQNTLYKFDTFTTIKPDITIHDPRLTSCNIKFCLRFLKIYPDDDTSPLVQVALFGLGSWINILLKPRVVASKTGLIGVCFCFFGFESILCGPLCQFCQRYHSVFHDTQSHRDKL